MPKPWDALCEVGVPAGAIRRTVTAIDPPKIAAALRAVISEDDALEPADRECLVAWLAAFRHHWPDRFTALLGTDGDQALARLRPSATDPNRYLKLRRIAAENLARII